MPAENTLSLLDQWRRGRGQQAYRNWDSGSHYYGCRLLKLLYASRLHRPPEQLQQRRGSEAVDGDNDDDDDEANGQPSRRVLLCVDRDRPLLFMSRLVFLSGGGRLCSVERQPGGGRLTLRRLGGSSTGLGGSSALIRRSRIGDESLYYSLPERAAACGHSAAVLALSRGGNALLQLCVTPQERLSLDLLVPLGGTGAKFVSLDWNEAGHSVVLDSTLGVPQGTLKSFLTLDVPSLACGTLIHVAQSAVPKAAKNLRLAQGALILHCGGRSVRIYDLAHALRLADYDDDYGEGEEAEYCKLGDHRSSLCLRRRRIRRLPPCLLALDCARCEAQFGKSPWHALYTPLQQQPQQQQQHQPDFNGGGRCCLYLVEPLDKSGPQTTKRLRLTVSDDNAVESSVCDAASGADDDGDNDDEDCLLAAFHPDESGRLLVTRPHSVSVLRALEDRLVTEFHFVATAADPADAAEAAVPAVAAATTRSGRPIRRRHAEAHNARFFQPRTVYCVDYEDELAVLAVLTGSPDPGQDAYAGCLHLFDSRSHRRLARLPLDGFRWREHEEVHLRIDRELILVSACVHNCAYKHALVCLI